MKPSGPKKLLGDFFSHLPANEKRSEISGVACDSREVKPGALFFAVPGAKHDGAAFIRQAAEKGACAAVISEDSALEPISIPLPIIRSSDIRRDYAKACAMFYGDPSSKLLCVGATGTNGKTSVSWIIHHALTLLGQKSSLCGTLGEQLATGAEFQSLPNSTPDARIVQQFLADAFEQGSKSAVLEATSQGIVQRRTYGVHWDAAVFTNLTRDHLDLHGTMEEYAAAKIRLFTEELAASSKSKRVAVTNLDDAVGRQIFDLVRSGQPHVRLLGYSLETSADVRAGDVESTMNRTEFDLLLEGKSIRLQSKLVGAFNVANLTASAACLFGLGYSPAEIQAAVAQVPPVPGRLEVIGTHEIHAVVDYAHTPDGLIQALRSLRPLTRNRLITVFGCGGDRDRGKRPLMGQAVAELADVAVVTSDNPRTEDPDRIIADIIPGVSSAQRRSGFRHVTEVDRKRAITWALNEAGEGDVVLIAGKGHEDYQEIGGVRYPFSDQQLCREILGLS